MVSKEIIFVFVFQPIRDYLLPPVVAILHTALKHNWIFIKWSFNQNSVWFKWPWDVFHISANQILWHDQGLNHVLQHRRSAR